MTIKELYYVTASGPARFVISGRAYSLVAGESRGPFTESEVKQAKQSSDRDRLHFVAFIPSTPVAKPKADAEATYKVETTVDPVSVDPIQEMLNEKVDTNPGGHIEVSPLVALEDSGPTVGEVVEDVIPVDNRTSFVESTEVHTEDPVAKLAEEEVVTPDVPEKKTRRRKKVEEVVAEVEE
jgi:hypothetical protein